MLQLQKSLRADGDLERCWLVQRDSLLMCRSLIRLTLIASLAYSQGSAFSGTGARFLGDRKRRRGNELLSSSPSNYSEKVIGECAVFEWSKQSDTLNNQGFNAQSFASSNCWGCRPFIFRGAFDPTLLLCPGREEVDRDASHAWPSWEDVVEIAADDDSEARIISHVPCDYASFELSWGPMTGKDKRAWLSKNKSSKNEKERRETLVVNDIDRFYPPLADWIFERFRFIPNWRMDDGQISLSEKGGGIGPHVDNYDVFLIQMSGTRTWQIDRKKISAHEERDRIIDGLDVRVLSGWPLNEGGGGEQDIEEWIVHPGDLLYLPPRVAHCGISLSGDCMTLSVGCRAPSVSDLVSKLAEHLSYSIEDYSVLRYTDSDMLKGGKLGTSPGELTLDAKERAKQLVMDSLTSIFNDDEWWDEFMGRYVTEQKRVRNSYPIPLDSLLVDGEDADEDNCDEWADASSTVQSVVAGKGVLCQAEGISFAYSTVRPKRHDGRVYHRFFVNGEMWQSDQSNDTKQSSLVHIFQIVANHREIDRSLLLLGLDSSNDPDDQVGMLSHEAIAFLEDLVSTGVLRIKSVK